MRRSILWALGVGLELAAGWPAAAQDAAEAQEPRVALSPQRPGGAPTETSGEDQAEKYENDPDAIAAGKQLYVAFNCNGCHAGGGGGMGPALTDDKWLFGGSLPNIVATLAEGRSKGMPPWRGKIPDEQMWQLAAYVKWLSRNGPPPPL